MIEIEQPEECVAAVVEHAHGAVVVYLLRADGQEVPITVTSSEAAIDLVNSMNPQKITLRVPYGEARNAMLHAFPDALIAGDPAPQARTIH